MIRLEHVALWTKNIETLKSFYVTYFDAEANEKYVNDEKKFQSYFLTFSDGVRLELMQRHDIGRIDRETPAQEFMGYAHMAMSVGSERAVDELTARLVADGYRRLDGPRYTGDSYYESVILDPEGNRIEITV